MEQPPKSRAATGIAILESPNSAIHSHRGPGAKIDKVSLVVEVTDGRAHQVAIERVEYLQRSCNADAWASRKPIAVASHTLATWNPVNTIAEAKQGVTIPAAAPQKYRVHARFVTPFEAYNACNVFAFDVDVVVDGARMKQHVPLGVEREEELRD